MNTRTLKQHAAISKIASLTVMSNTGETEWATRGVRLTGRRGRFYDGSGAEVPVPRVPSWTMSAWGVSMSAASARLFAGEIRRLIEENEK